MSTAFALGCLTFSTLCLVYAVKAYREAVRECE